ncbi:MAG: alpha/beta fold hydrolase [Alphaproteobacteria bacterium]|nr:alpha/beta fold hydrolase [Alphaproteobacteria bacterium]
MTIRLPYVIVLALLAACSPAGAPDGGVDDPYAAERPIRFSALIERERPAADHRIAYGDGPLQFGELWLPASPGPHPLVIMIHGGCWLSTLPGLELQDLTSADLRARGMAVWNLEYARIGHDQGGWPGTFLDIAAGVNHARTLSDSYPLDLGRVVLVGHSAGGHLALWAAARSAIASGPLAPAAPPLPVAGVVSLAGIADLEAFSAQGPGRCGEPDTVTTLIGAERGEAGYVDTSPARLLTLGVPQVMVSGELDTIIPPAFGTGYTDAAIAAGDSVTHLSLAGAGHFELIDPAAPAWAIIVDQIERLQAHEVDE